MNIQTNKLTREKSFQAFKSHKQAIKIYLFGMFKTFKAFDFSYESI
jgi:hypothetical protein